MLGPEAAVRDAHPSLLLRLVFGSASRSGASLSTGSGSSSEVDILAVRRRLQFTIIVTVALSSLATAGGVLAYQRLIRSYRRHDLEDSAQGRGHAGKYGQSRRGKGDETDSLRGKSRLLDCGSPAGLPSDGANTPRTRTMSAVDVLGDLASLDSATPDSSTASPAPRYLGTLTASMPGPDAYRNMNLRRKQSRPAMKWDETLLREQLTRNYSFLGEEGMARVRNSFVIVVGAGGVGSWAALMLLRSGVSHLRIIDFDQVSLSSLNRHACATLADVGRPKVVCLAEYFAKVAPWAKVEAWVDVFKADDADRLLQGDPDWVIDAIDSIDPKIDLIKYCFQHNIKILASMGAGGKADPSRVQISDISDTFEDPLAASVRRRLRAFGIPPLPPKQHHWAPSKKELRRVRKAQAEQTQAEQTQAEQTQAEQTQAEQTQAEQTQRKPGENGNLGKNSASLTRRATNATITTEKFANALAQTTSAPNAPANASSNANPGAAASMPPPQTPQSSSSRTGPSARRHSRRPSSTSSLGSGVYSTPLSTPKLEADDESFDAAGAGPLSPLEDVLEGSESEHRYTPQQGSESLGDATVSIVGAPESMDGTRPYAEGDGLQEVVPESEADKLEITSDGEGSAPGATGGTDGAPGEEGEAEPMMMIPCVYSTEKSDVTLLPLPDDEFEKGKVDELSPLEQMRVRILPVLGSMPAMFGLAAATYVICQIGGHKIEPLAHKRRRKLYDKIYSDLDHSERRHPPFRTASDAPPPLLFNANDIAFLFEEIFAGRTIVPPFESLSHAQMMRWDASLPLSWSNIALFSRTQAKIHEKEVLAQGKSPHAIWGEGAAKRLRVCQARERYLREIREM
ncbi:hypothetical protein K437DRAFT_294972 [Tilletiaria anomala UBC 951]|uniref:THIF-type NAD/FAD binding fold domain-containing protein n=1 Tax=Tilletiaria anomala (strain ATCC 24038 / CBS 436.72 / UBC 951) TaxID=1037660 RepID=A0A066VRH6_TILAU|nr:uncharacterized protein K437DRAFT_294972 [Tilletiaria anomala UBC 951]KDN44096.1 hypothetical protein K437DRAFT_294972 [Tilletiaria anomala UBC 951]